ncbi:nucleotidyltransferase family protein [Desulfobotulus mexicanus]|uniref:Nucleotidyltransferase family protein n=1 Tax=Desulfobotulus mexicanus TaxID=2586642 RepID=A0A5Q4VDI3_9BACT|nr:nucleotidyltransferase family protein [Desulfobotulus mexicanus]TYT75023.1 nucleotidyltransferase family protein [Desulfobotulus mexicanus]
MDLLVELKNIIEALDKKKIAYALCGGLALAVYARPRATLDIDIMVEPDLLDEIKDVLSDLGYNIPAAPMFFKNNAIQIHRLTKIDSDSEEHLMVDLLLATPEVRDSWEKRVTVDWDNSSLTVLSPEGLIFLKSLRKSGQDLDDIHYLKELVDEN